MLFYTPLRSGAGRGNDAGHVRDQLSAYIDYELSDAERAQVREHLRHCPDCENDLATLKATKQVLADRPLMAAPRSFALTPEMVGRGQLAPVVRRQVWSLAARLRAGSVAAALVFLLLFLTNQVSPLPSSAIHAPGVRAVQTGAKAPAATQGFDNFTAMPAAAAPTNTAAPALFLAIVPPPTPSTVAPAAGGAAASASDTPPATNGILPPAGAQQDGITSTDTPPPTASPMAAETNAGVATASADTPYAYVVTQPAEPNTAPPQSDGESPLATLGWVQLFEGALLVLAVGLALASVLAMRQGR